jgi:hypothetical protein
MPRYEALSAPVSSDFYDEWYDRGQHFWIQWRFRALGRLLDVLGLPRAVAWTGLDIGLCAWSAHPPTRKCLAMGCRWLRRNEGIAGQKYAGARSRVTLNVNEYRTQTYPNLDGVQSQLCTQSGYTLSNAWMRI